MLRKKRYKIQRQLATALPGFGDKKAKSPLTKRPFPPGTHGRTFRRKLSEFGVKLKEKQKVRHHYGLKEKQIRIMIKKAKRKESNWFNVFISLAERRLDNLVYRLGFFPTMASARQAVVHGKVLVNGRKLDRPSAVMEIGAEISLKDKTYQNILVVQTMKEPTLDLPHFLSSEEIKGKTVGKLVDEPKPEDIPFQFDLEHFLVYYGKVK